MKLGYLMTAAAATVLAGVMAMGCDSKKTDDAAATPTHDAPNPAPGSNMTPATADKAADTATQNMGAKLNAMGQDAKAAVANGGSMLDAEKQKMQDKMGATTMPSTPSMPSMPSMGH